MFLILQAAGDARVAAELGSQLRRELKAEQEKLEAARAEAARLAEDLNKSRASQEAEGKKNAEHFISEASMLAQQVISTHILQKFLALDSYLFILL